MDKEGKYFRWENCHCEGKWTRRGNISGSEIVTVRENIKWEIVTARENGQGGNKSGGNIVTVAEYRGGKLTKKMDKEGNTYEKIVRVKKNAQGGKLF
jgi:hypothetical protein